MVLIIHTLIVTRLRFLCQNYGRIVQVQGSTGCKHLTTDNNNKSKGLPLGKFCSVVCIWY